jgi:hypothetical protein
VYPFIFKGKRMKKYLNNPLIMFLLIVILFNMNVLICQDAPSAQNKIVPGKIQATPTWCCMGINWYYSSDNNKNASAAFAFRRKGTKEWQDALVPYRITKKKYRMFSGSIFRLAPGVEYEFKLTLKDPDGGSEEKIFTASTRAYPVMPAKTAQADSLADAEEKAEPGTVVLIKPGTYKALTLQKSGKPGQPIVYRPDGNGTVTIKGQMVIQGNYIWLHGLIVRNEESKTAVLIRKKNKGCYITNCRLYASYCIWVPSGGADIFISDNFLQGVRKGVFSFGGEGVDFGKSAGNGGSAVCFNEFTDLADGVSYGRGNIDVYNNFMHETLDDFIEPDYAYENYRLWNNRCYNTMCGFSFQPIYSGPWYIFDNINVGAYLHALKVKEIYGCSVIVGNTFMSKSSRTNHIGSLIKGPLINNLWIRAQKGGVGEKGRFSPGHFPTTVDYNAYSMTSKEPFTGMGYSKLKETHGWDKHSIIVDWTKIFQKTPELPKGNPRYPAPKGKPIPKDWHFEHNLLLPKEDSPLVDAGTVLPNITGPFLGETRDIGAHESGLGTAWYGPRVWDDGSGLVYGKPEGWKKVDISEASRYKDLGCAAQKDTKVLLVSDTPRVFALLRVKPLKGEERWARAEEEVSFEKGSLCKILKFQDGLYARLYKTDENILLVCARVQADGILIAEAGCKEEDLPNARLKMFQFVRSLVR